jgi:hypothetical protein
MLYVLSDDDELPWSDVLPQALSDATIATAVAAEITFLNFFILISSSTFYF